MRLVGAAVDRSSFTKAFGVVEGIDEAVQTLKQSVVGSARALEIASRSVVGRASAAANKILFFYSSLGCVGTSTNLRVRHFESQSNAS